MKTQSQPDERSGLEASSQLSTMDIV